MINKNGEDDLTVTYEFKKEVEMIRQQTTQKFLKDGQEGEVHLVNVKEHFKPNRHGRFTEVKPWREELVIKYKVPERGTESEYTSFIQEVMKLSYKLEDVTYQEVVHPELKKLSFD